MASSRFYRFIGHKERVDKRGWGHRLDPNRKTRLWNGIELPIPRWSSLLLSGKVLLYHSLSNSNLRCWKVLDVCPLNYAFQQICLFVRAMTPIRNLRPCLLVTLYIYIHCIYTYPALYESCLRNWSTRRYLGWSSWSSTWVAGIWCITCSAKLWTEIC